MNPCSSARKVGRHCAGGTFPMFVYYGDRHDNCPSVIGRDRVGTKIYIKVEH
jgi:hypothetical protein